MATKKIGKPRRTVAIRKSATGTWTFVCETSSLCEILVSNVDKVHIDWRVIYNDRRFYINGVEWKFDLISNNTFKNYISSCTARRVANGIYQIS